MKVIDLLNKIANGEDKPKKIKWGVHNLTWFVYEYRALDELGEPNLFECAGSISRSLLTDEVEIIEDPPKEDKKIEKLDLQYKDITKGIKFEEQILMYCDNLQYKINEIIDKVNGEDHE